MAHWADALYACDYAWWEHHNGVPEFTGLKITQDHGRQGTKAFGCKSITVKRNSDRMLFEHLGEVGWGGNGGFHAVNLVAQMQPKAILLVGFDMRVDHGVHWHGTHGGHLNNPTRNGTARWRETFDNAAPILKARGVRVINCSAVSALTAYPKMDFKEALDMMDAA